MLAIVLMCFVMTRIAVKLNIVLGLFVLNVSLVELCLMQLGLCLCEFGLILNVFPICLCFHIHLNMGASIKQHR